MARQQTLADDLARVLESEIVSGVLKPGDRLDERLLAQRFQVSRTPVREALAKLAMSELAMPAGGRGLLVAAISLTRLLEMFEVMAELEAFCAELAARRVDDKELDHLTRLHDECCQLRDSGAPDAYYTVNMHFHEAIYAASKNGFLERQTRQLRNRLSPYRRLQLHRPGRLSTSSHEHESVIDALRQRDAQAASQAMREHVTVQGGALNDLVAILPAGYLLQEAG